MYFSSLLLTLFNNHSCLDASIWFAISGAFFQLIGLLETIFSKKIIEKLDNGDKGYSEVYKFINRLASGNFYLGGGFSWINIFWLVLGIFLLLLSVLSIVFSWLKILATCAMVISWSGLAVSGVGTILALLIYLAFEFNFRKFVATSYEPVYTSWSLQTMFLCFPDIDGLSEKHFVFGEIADSSLFFKSSALKILSLVTSDSKVVEYFSSFLSMRWSQNKGTNEALSDDMVSKTVGVLNNMSHILFEKVGKEVLGNRWLKSAAEDNLNALIEDRNKLWDDLENSINNGRKERFHIVKEPNSNIWQILPDYIANFFSKLSKESNWESPLYSRPVYDNWEGYIYELVDLVYLADKLYPEALEKFANPIISEIDSRFKNEIMADKISKIGLQELANKNVFNLSSKWQSWFDRNVSEFLNKYGEIGDLKRMHNAFKEVDESLKEIFEDPYFFDDLSSDINNYISKKWGFGSSLDEVVSWKAKCFMFYSGIFKTINMIWRPKSPNLGTLAGLLKDFKRWNNYRYDYLHKRFIHYPFKSRETKVRELFIFLFELECSFYLGINLGYGRSSNLLEILKYKIG